MSGWASFTPGVLPAQRLYHCCTPSLNSVRLQLVVVSAAVLQLDDTSVRTHGLKVWSGSVLLALWFVVLVVTLVLGATLASPPPPLQWWKVSAERAYGG